MRPPTPSLHTFLNVLKPHSCATSSLRAYLGLGIARKNPLGAFWRHPQLKIKLMIEQIVNTVPVTPLSSFQPHTTEHRAVVIFHL
jgi:hypothetical protein